MASFLGQKEVEQCALATVHAAILFLLRADEDTGMRIVHDLVGPSAPCKGFEHEWMQVIYVRLIVVICSLW